METQNTLIEIRTGSDSDIPKIKEAYYFFQQLDILFSPRILSAHRTPAIMASEAGELSKKGYRISISAAGGSAHLPGMTASETLLPVIGIPVQTSLLGGIDSLLSILQMPEGIPVGTVGIGQAENAALAAAQMAFLDNIKMRNKIREKKGIHSMLSGEFKIKPRVTILKGDDATVDSDAYEKMLKLLAEFELEVQEYKLHFDNQTEKNGFLADLEHGESVMIIVINPLNSAPSGASAEAFLSQHTDIPVVTLPVTAQSGKNWQVVLHHLLQHVFAQNQPVPVVSMGINRYGNAALYAIQVAALYFPKIQEKLKTFRTGMTKKVEGKDKILVSKGLGEFL